MHSWYGIKTKFLDEKYFTYTLPSELIRQISTSAKQIIMSHCPKNEGSWQPIPQAITQNCELREWWGTHLV